MLAERVYRTWVFHWPEGQRSINYYSYRIRYILQVNLLCLSNSCSRVDRLLARFLAKAD